MSDSMERLTVRHCERCDKDLVNGRGGCEGAQHGNQFCAMNNPEPYLAQLDMSKVEERVVAHMVDNVKDATMLAATDALVKGLGIVHVNLESLYNPIPPKESYRDRVIGMSTERGDFIQNDDGYQVYWPKRESLGYLGAAELRILADHLDWLNEEWDAEVRKMCSREPTSTVALGWQPIETAPRNYTPILLKQDDAVGEGCHASHLRIWEFYNPAWMMRRAPTHWMPLPSARAADPTSQPNVAPWGRCVWCDAPSDTKDKGCSAPDGDGHLFKRATDPTS